MMSTQEELGALLKHRGAAQLYLKFSKKAEESLGLMYELSSLAAFRICAGSGVDMLLGTLLASQRRFTWS